MTDASPDPDPDPIDDPAPRSDSRFIVVLLVVLGVGILGGLPWAMGLGPFGLRQFLSHDVTLWVINTSGQDLTIQLTNDPPRLVRNFTVEQIDTLSGQTVVATLNAAGEVLEEHPWDLQEDALLNALGSECMAVVDLDGYYGEGADGQLDIVARIRRDDRLYTLQADQVLLPRHTMPDTIRGTMHWIETVNCELLDEERTLTLASTLAARMATRRAELENQRAQQAIQAVPTAP